MEKVVSQLRIGNLLQNGNGGELLRVKEIREGGYDCEVIDRSKYPLKDGWFAQGIKLTEIWLRKAGMSTLDFESNYVEWGYEKDNGANFALIQTNFEEPLYFKYDLGCGVQEIEINTVHHLQNIYFMLTGNEIEFKL
jgi:hypothetical protein